MKDMVEGTTVPGPEGDAVILEVQKQFPTAVAVLVLVSDEAGGLTVQTMTSLPAPVLIGAVAEYVHSLAVELGMDP